jgi:hypothetical protein
LLSPALGTVHDCWSLQASIHALCTRRQVSVAAQEYQGSELAWPNDCLQVPICVSLNGRSISCNDSFQEIGLGPTVMLGFPKGSVLRRNVFRPEPIPMPG